MEGRFPPNIGFPGSQARELCGTSRSRFHFHFVYLQETAMKTAIPVLTGAMLALLAGPALAGHSTPQEREATRQLNLEAAQQAKSTNQQIAAANTNTNTSTTMQTQSAPAAAPTAPVESAPADANQNAEPGANATPPAAPQ